MRVIKPLFDNQTMDKPTETTKEASGRSEDFEPAFFCAGMSNLVQNVAPGRVIVGLAEIRKEKLFQESLRQLPHHENHPYMRKESV